MTALRRALALLVIALTAIGPVAFGQAPDNDQGLAIFIAKAVASPRMFRVELRNMGETELNLYLGVALGNGKQFLTEVHLLLTNQDGYTYDLRQEGMGVVGGTISPVMERIPKRTSYYLVIDLDQCLSSKDKLWPVKQGDVWRLPLPAGRYQVRALYEISVKSDPVVAMLKSVWTGRVVSEPMSIVIEK